MSGQVAEPKVSTTLACSAQIAEADFVALQGQQFEVRSLFPRLRSVAEPRLGNVLYEGTATKFLVVVTR